MRYQIDVALAEPPPWGGRGLSFFQNDDKNHTTALFRGSLEVKTGGAFCAARQSVLIYLTIIAC